jgi:hypothetical protein
MKSIALACLVLAATTSITFASTPGINARQKIQSYRILEGAVSGRLTPGETKKLVHGQIRVQNLENHAKSDGVVTPLERARISAAQNIQSARIFLKKHN